MMHEVTNFPKVALYFRFYGETFDPDEITRRLDITPTLSFRPGDPITEDGQGDWRAYGWMVELGPLKTLEVDDLLQEFRQRLDVPAATVRQLCGDLDIELVIVCGVGLGGAETAPGLYFPNEFLEWVADLGASLNVDVEF